MCIKINNFRCSRSSTDCMWTLPCMFVFGGCCRGKDFCCFERKKPIKILNKKNQEPRHVFVVKEKKKITEYVNPENNQVILPNSDYENKSPRKTEFPYQLMIYLSNPNFIPFLSPLTSILCPPNTHQLDDSNCC